MTTIDSEGRPAVIQYYLAFEGDVDKAIALVRKDFSMSANEAAEAILPISRFAFERRGIKRGQVKPEDF